MLIALYNNGDLGDGEVGAKLVTVPISDQGSVPDYLGGNRRVTQFLMSVLDIQSEDGFAQWFTQPWFVSRQTAYLPFWLLMMGFAETKNASRISTAVIFTRIISMMPIQRGGSTAEMLAMTLFSEP